jgi:chemotaxis protein CheC
MSDEKAIWSRLINGPHSEHRLRSVMWRVAGGLSELTGRTITNDDPVVERVPIYQVTERAGGPEDKMVGIYLVMSGGMHGQAIMILPMSSALNLVDLMMGEEPGTATQLGMMQHSALSELGNMTVSCFLNGVAALDETPELLRPSPPAVMVDMLGAILDVIVTPVAAVRDDLLIIDTPFRDHRRTVQGRFWVLPNPAIPDLTAQASTTRGDTSWLRKSTLSPLGG